jgi:hypothetical protein
MSQTITKPGLSTQESVCLILLLSTSLIGATFGSASTASRIELSLIYAWFGIGAILIEVCKTPSFCRQPQTCSLPGQLICEHKRNVDNWGLQPAHSERYRHCGMHVVARYELYEVPPSKSDCDVGARRSRPIARRRQCAVLIPNTACTSFLRARDKLSSRHKRHAYHEPRLVLQARRYV